MRALLVAFLFASIIMVTTSLKSPNIQFIGVDQIDAQRIQYTLVVRKVVEGNTPDSDWEFVGSPPLGSFTIDKAGGETTFLLDDNVLVTIIEITKSNFIVYVRQWVSGDPPNPFYTTHVMTTKLTGETLCGYGEFSNNYSSSPKLLRNPVGGVNTSVNKFSILVPYLALAVLTGVILSVIVINKKRRSP